MTLTNPKEVTNVQLYIYTLRRTCSISSPCHIFFMKGISTVQLFSKLKNYYYCIRRKAHKLRCTLFIWPALVGYLFSLIPKRYTYTVYYIYCIALLFSICKVRGLTMKQHIWYKLDQSQDIVWNKYQLHIQFFVHV